MSLIKGKSKGKGAFQGNCNHCGQTGHKKWQCPELDKIMAERRKQQGNNGGFFDGGNLKGKTGWGQDGNGWTTKGFSGWQSRGSFGPAKGAGKNWKGFNNGKFPTMVLAFVLFGA